MRHLIILTVLVNLCLGSFCQKLTPAEQAFEDRMQRKEQERQLKKQNPEAYYKGGGYYLKQSGQLFYWSIATGAVGGTVFIVGNNLVSDKEIESPNPDPNYYKKQHNIVNGVSGVILGTAMVLDFVAIGKLIQAGNAFEAERKAREKNVSLNVTGNGLSLTYKF